MTQNPESYALRGSNITDLNFVTLVHHETLRKYIEPLFGWNKKDWDGHVSKWFQPWRVQIIAWGGEDIGFLALDEEEDTLHLESICILKAYQKQGVGKTVIQDIMALAEQKSLPIHLDILKTNKPAKRLFEGLGFRVYAETEAHEQMAWGTERP